MKLVVGLWNPWQQYKATRHNVWVMMLESFLSRENLGELKYDNKWKAEILITNHFWDKVIFCVPQTYMNSSWESVWPLAKFYKIQPEDILVLHDEIDFEVWKVALKKWWSAAWHNWLRSIMARLWTTEFQRIRIWIWRPALSIQVADYVLSTFKPKEKELLANKYDEISDLVLSFLWR